MFQKEILFPGNSAIFRPRFEKSILKDIIFIFATIININYWNFRMTGWNLEKCNNPLSKRNSVKYGARNILLESYAIRDILYKRLIILKHWAVSQINTSRVCERSLSLFSFSLSLSFSFSV